jgi:hypothetical protein
MNTKTNQRELRSTEYSPLERGNRTTIVIPNNKIDAILITQISDGDTVFIEIQVIHENMKFFTASMYFALKIK